MHSRTLLPARLLTLVTALLLTATGFAGQPVARADPATEANITRLTAAVLRNSQLAHRALDRALADAFLDRYLDALDPERLLFLESDVAELAAYRATLARDTIRNGDNDVAHVVFERFLQRVRERAQYVGEALATSEFDFTGNDAYMLDRSGAARATRRPRARCGGSGCGWITCRRSSRARRPRRSRRGWSAAPGAWSRSWSR